MFLSPGACGRFVRAGIGVPDVKLRKPELLAIVMRSGQPGQNVADLARELVLRAGGRGRRGSIRIWRLRTSGWATTPGFGTWR